MHDQLMLQRQMNNDQLEQVTHLHHMQADRLQQMPGIMMNFQKQTVLGDVLKSQSSNGSVNTQVLEAFTCVADAPSNQTHSSPPQKRPYPEAAAAAAGGGGREDSGLSPGSALLKEANDHVQRATKLRRRVAQLDPVLDESLIKETESNIEGLEQKAQALKRKAMEV